MFYPNPKTFAFLIFSISVSLSFGQNTWHPVGQGLGSNSHCYSLAKVDGVTMVGGYIFDANDLGMIDDILLKTEGINYGHVTSPAILNYSAVYSIIEHHNDLIVGGSFSSVGGNGALSGVARWDGNQWFSLGSGASTSSPGDVFALAVFNNEIYAGGNFLNMGGNPDADYIAKWDGNNWVSVGTGVNHWVRCFEIANGDLYVGGHFDYINAGSTLARGVAKWDGGQWYPLTDSCNGLASNFAVYSILNNGNNTYLGISGGSIECNSTAYYSNDVKIYNGVSISDFGSDVFGVVRTIEEHEGEIYIGGTFQNAGGNPNADYLAKWDGSNWSDIGFPMNDVVYAMESTSNGLYVGGKFLYSSSFPYNRGLMRYGPPIASPSYDLYHYLQDDNNTNFIEPFFIWSVNTNGISSIPLGVCTDGSDISMFVIKQTFGPGVYNSAFTLNIKEEPYPQPELYGEFEIDEVRSGPNGIVFRYTHPKIYPLNGSTILTIQMTDGMGTVLGEFPLELFRPGLLMVHGLWSSDKAFSKLENVLTSQSDFNESLLFNCSYKDSNDLHFAQNANVIPEKILQLQFGAALNHIAAGKVDIVSHSMGGILARLYLQSSSYNHNINRLITLNTPHSGSQLGNCASELANIPIIGNSFCFLLSKIIGDPCKGAVEDLAVDSAPVINQLIGNISNEVKVPSHLIITHEEIPNIPSPPPFVTQVLNFGKRANLFVAMLIKVWETIDLTTESLSLATQLKFNGDTHDLIVPDSSQRADIWVNNYTTVIENQMHIGAAKNDSIISRTIELLRELPNSNKFTLSGFNPYVLAPPFSLLNNNIVNKKEINNTPSVSITELNGNINFHPGDTITLLAEGNAEIVEIGILMDYDEDFSYFALSLGDSLQVSFPMDSISGERTIFAIGKSNSGDFVVSEIELHNCPSDIILNSLDISTSEHFAEISIESNGTIDGNSQVYFSAGNSITLDPGFCITKNAILTIEIDGCGN